MNKTTEKLLILAGPALLALAMFLVCLAPRRATDQSRYAYLHRCGRALERVRNGRFNLQEQIEAGLHRTNPRDYYRTQMEAEARALLKSGYFVQTTVPVPDLRAKLTSEFTSLSNTFRLSGAYYEARFNWPSNEVLLVCRTQDVPLFRKALKVEAPDEDSGQQVGAGNSRCALQFGWPASLAAPGLRLGAGSSDCA
jgi:hypothetical protein